jgi:hypothetical protein
MHARPLLPRGRLHLLRAFCVFMARGQALHAAPPLRLPGAHDGGAVTVVRAVLGVSGLPLVLPCEVLRRPPVRGVQRGLNTACHRRPAAYRLVMGSCKGGS